MSMRRFNKLASVVSIIALIAGLCGCGADEEEQEPSLSEMLVGSWAIVSIEGEDLNSGISSLADEDEYLATARVFKNEIICTGDGAMFMNLGVEYIYDSALLGVPVTMRWIIAGKWEYTVSGRTLTTIGEGANVTIGFEPEEFDGYKFEDFLDVEKFEQELLRGFVFHISNETVVISGNTLTLTDEDGEESVLKRK